METRQVVRVIVFSIVNFLPNLLAYWLVAVMPEIIEINLKITNKGRLSEVASLFYAMGHFGMIVGSFIMPHMLDYMSYRTIILLGMIIECILNALMGQVVSLYFIYFIRFFIGFFLNMNSVGKAFVFEFANINYRQYAFSVRTEFTFVAIFCGPLLGYYVYMYSGRSFSLSLIYMSGTYLIGIVLFYIVFFLDYHPSKEHRVSETPEEA